MKSNDPGPNCIETDTGFRIKTPNPFACTLCGEEKGGVMLWPSRSDKGFCSVRWLCYPCRTERLIEEYDGIPEPHRNAAWKRIREGLDN